MQEMANAAKEQRTLAPLLPDHLSLDDIAGVIRPDRPVHQATVRALLDRAGAKFVKVGGARWYHRDVVLRALAELEQTRP